MCGINGFNFNDKELIRKMNDRIKHRGPDDKGVYLDTNISLGHQRLSIIDLSKKGRQPIFNEDKSFCIIFNGEIYNFQKLRKDLEERGHKFRSKTDTEVVLHLYEDYREKCLEMLNGIFAFAIWDIRQKKLFLARDRIGVKPLYYYYKDNNFIFSSEIKAILEHEIKKEVDLEALNHYFRLLYVPAPLTMFKNIYKLPQGHYLQLKNVGDSNSCIEIKKYWEVNDFKEINSKDEIIGKIQELMKQSVKGQLISDRPLGIFLSGGIDSTSVLGMANEFISGKIKTFTVGFNVNDPVNKFNQDFLLARQTSKFYRTDHHELLINSRDFLDNVEKVIYHLDEPIAEATQIATFLLSKYTKKNVAVVLGGDGGDELFGGYGRYYYSQLMDRYQKMPAFLRRRISPFLIEKIARKKDAVEKLNLPKGVERYAQFMFQKEMEVGKILNNGINQRIITKKFFQEKYFRNMPTKDFENYFMLVDLKTWLVDESLMRTDKMTMAHGLEQRVPVLDHYLVELAMKIPSKFKIKSRKEGKAIFKEAMNEYLPKHILESAYKKVWLSPMSNWLRTDLNDFAQSVLSPDYCLATKEYFDFQGVNKMFTDHVDKKEYNLNLIWAIITFQIWYKNTIESV